MEQLILRQAVIEAIEKNACNTQRIFDAVKALLSAEPKRGKWIDTRGNTEWYAREYECSECGDTMLGESNFCPNCGAKMEVTT